MSILIVECRDMTLMLFVSVVAPQNVVFVLLRGECPSGCEFEMVLQDGLLVIQYLKGAIRMLEEWPEPEWTIGRLVPHEHIELGIIPIRKLFPQYHVHHKSLVSLAVFLLFLSFLHRIEPLGNRVTLWIWIEIRDVV